VFFIKSLGTHISEHKGHKEMSLSNPMVEFLNPEYVYIPLVEQNTPCEAVVKVGDLVKVGQVVANKGGRFGLPLHSSVSGEIVSIDKKMWHASGKMVPHIQIKNDFMETKVDTIKACDVSSLTKEEIIEKVKQNGIVGLGGSGFPAYVKYQVKDEMDVVIINAVECEPFITVDYKLIKDHFDKILRGIKYIMQVVGAKRGVIAIKKNKKELIEKMNLALENEPNISVFTVKDEYPAGWEKYIVQRVTNKNYKVLPSEAGAVVNNSSTAAAVAAALEENQPLVEKMVTITGEGVKTPCNVYVKIGTAMNEILDKIGGYAQGLEEAYFIAGGPMTGKSIMFDTLVVHRSLSSVIVLPKEIRELNPECMGCGKCGEVCPVFLSPIAIKETLENDTLEELRTLRPNLCMECGLCSYICPSRIELTDAVSKAKAKVMVK
jgi:electron transport complex protein RnfC